MTQPQRRPIVKLRRLATEQARPPSQRIFLCSSQKSRHQDLVKLLKNRKTTTRLQEPALKSQVHATFQLSRAQLCIDYHHHRTYRGQILRVQNLQGDIWPIPKGSVVTRCLLQPVQRPGQQGTLRYLLPRAVGPPARHRDARRAAWLVSTTWGRGRCQPSTM